jgi:PAS domain S-box-containing protein
MEEQELAQARQEASGRLAAILAVSPDAIISKTLDGIVTSWNAGAQRLFGYTQEEMIGAPILCLIRPERREEEDRILERIRAGEIVERYETVRLAKDGQRLEVSLTMSPVKDSKGRIIGALEIARDISARRLADAASRWSEKRQAFLLGLNDELRDVADPKTVMEVTARSLGEFLAINRVGYGEIDPAEEFVLVEQDWNDGTIGTVAGSRRMKHFGPAIIDALKQGRTLRIDDVTVDPRANGAEALASFRAIGTRAVLAVPLVKAGRMRAMLYFHHAEPHRWSNEEVALAEEVAERTWSAVERTRAEAALAESEERYRSIYDQAAVGIKRVSVKDGRILEANARLYEMLGYGLEKLIGLTVADLTHPDDLPQEQALMARLLADEIRNYVIEKRYRRADGSDIWVRVTSSLAKTGGEPYRISIVEDVEDRKQAEIALSEHAERLRLALDAARMGDWSWDAGTDLVTLSERAAEIFGIPPGPHMTWTRMRGLLHPDDAKRARKAVEDAIANRAQYDLDYRIRRASDGRDAWVAAKGQAVYGADGRVRGMTGVVQDITERKRVEERQSLLIRELHHRVKNTLATVQAIVGSTARTSTSIDEFYRAFVGRIVSLAHTHSLLTEDEWQTVPLRKLLADELRPYDEGARRVVLRGPDVELPSGFAVPIGMAIHELTTNAAKYGSLSRRSGRVEVGWAISAGENGHRRLELEWRERDGPPVSPPKHQGFGSRLLQRVLTTQVQANVTIDFEPEGLRLKMVAPLPERPSFLAALPA